MSFGIIHRDNGDFFKKIIYTQGMTEDNNMTEGETVDENLTTELKDKIKVIQEGDRLKIDMPVENNGRVVIVWRRVYDLDIRDELREAKHEYIKYYRERFINTLRMISQKSDI